MQSYKTMAMGVKFMYPFGRHDMGIGKKTRRVMILLIIALLLLNVVQFAVYRSTFTQDSKLKDTLIAQVRADITSARSLSAQLSRLGGSSTQRYLAEIRQYLYGVSQLNGLTGQIFGGGQRLVPQDTVTEAVAAVDACEARLQEALAIDTPMAELQQALAALKEAADALL